MRELLLVFLCLCCAAKALSQTDNAVDSDEEEWSGNADEFLDTACKSGGCTCDGSDDKEHRMVCSIPQFVQMGTDLCTTFKRFDFDPRKQDTWMTEMAIQADVENQTPFVDGKKIRLDLTSDGSVQKLMSSKDCSGVIGDVKCVQVCQATRRFFDYVDTVKITDTGKTITALADAEDTPLLFLFPSMSAFEFSSERTEMIDLYFVMHPNLKELVIKGITSVTLHCALDLTDCLSMIDKLDLFDVRSLKEVSFEDEFKLPYRIGTLRLKGQWQSVIVNGRSFRDVYLEYVDGITPELPTFEDSYVGGNIYVIDVNFDQLKPLSKNLMKSGFLSKLILQNNKEANTWLMDNKGKRVMIPVAYGEDIVLDDTYFDSCHLAFHFIPWVENF